MYFSQSLIALSSTLVLCAITLTISSESTSGAGRNLDVLSLNGEKGRNRYEQRQVTTSMTSATTPTTSATNSTSTPACTDRILIPHDGINYYYINSTTQGFSIRCSVNYAQGPANFNPNIHDFQIFEAKNMETCIRQCAIFNSQLGQLSYITDACTGVTYYQSYCYFKKGVTANAVSSNTQGDSAILYMMNFTAALLS